jgi:hypothetical protein
MFLSTIHFFAYYGTFTFLFSLVFLVFELFSQNSEMASAAMSTVLYLSGYFYPECTVVC